MLFLFGLLAGLVLAFVTPRLYRHLRHSAKKARPTKDVLLSDFLTQATELVTVAQNPGSFLHDEPVFTSRLNFESSLRTMRTARFPATLEKHLSDLALVDLSDANHLASRALTRRTLEAESQKLEQVQIFLRTSRSHLSSQTMVSANRLLERYEDLLGTVELSLENEKTRSDIDLAAQNFLVAFQHFVKLHAPVAESTSQEHIDSVLTLTDNHEVPSV